MAKRLSITGADRDFDLDDIVSRICVFLMIAGGLTLAAEPTTGQEPKSAAAEKPLLLAHYMPWYSVGQDVANPGRARWGWHWTMNHFDPEKISDGRREIASHFYPLIGPYDSGDANVIEYHLLLMKLAGIDGVIVDWYGLTNYRDYGVLHQNTKHLVEQVGRLNLRRSEASTNEQLDRIAEAIVAGRMELARSEIRVRSKGPR